MLELAPLPMLPLWTLQHALKVSLFTQTLFEGDRGRPLALPTANTAGSDPAVFCKRPVLAGSGPQIACFPRSPGLNGVYRGQGGGMAGGRAGGAGGPPSPHPLAQVPCSGPRQNRRMSLNSGAQQASQAAKQEV